MRKGEKIKLKRENKLNAIEKEINRVSAILERTKKSHPDEKLKGRFDILYEDLEVGAKLARRIDELYGVESLIISINMNESIMIIRMKKQPSEEDSGEINIDGEMVTYFFKSSLIKIR